MSNPFPYRTQLEMPVVGIEAEFKVFVDEREVTPEEHWRTPSAFIDRPLLKRASRSLQLPTGGALYFDGGVIEVVTPVIEIAPQCTARAVRSLWEQIGFVRDQLDRWESRHQERVRLQAFSAHFNISFELSREKRGRNRTIQKLAFLLARLLPVPVIVASANRRSTGIGVRPRRDRIEITLDFTPDPGLMAANAALIVGIAREVISWPAYLPREAEARSIPLLIGVEPGKHPTRNGWVVRDYHFPRNPFEADPDEPVWETSAGVMSLRGLALATALPFRQAIRAHSDSFSEKLLFSVFRGETPALLDLPDRPPEYDDVGRSVRWGTVLPELANYEKLMNETEKGAPLRRRADLVSRLEPPWRGAATDRRSRVMLPPRIERRAAENRRRSSSIRPAAPRLTRSVYEQLFLKIANGKRLQIGGELLTPVAVKGWYHSLFHTPSGEERLLTLDQILEGGGRWRE